MPPRHAAPVRKRLTVLKDGTTESCEIVFCEAELKSVPVSRCAACPFAGSTFRETARDGTVDCGLSILPDAGNIADANFPPAVAAALPVGLALRRPVLCVEDNLPWVEVSRAPTLAGSQSAVPIVDHGGGFVGVLPVSAMDLASQNETADILASVADRAVSAAWVRESESLSDAFVTMGVRHLREVTVVGDEFQVVGVLRDVDALRFVAHVARTGKRPALMPVAA